LVSLCRSETLKKHTAPPERNYLFSLAINISLLTERRRLPEVGRDFGFAADFHQRAP
jgi:hypothetical protein